MQSLLGKHIVLGVSGGIAAYKAAELVRRLRDAGAIVRVVMTAGAQEFVTPLTFQALSGNPVHTALLDPAAEAGMGHIELARWADAVLIAPATANLIARLAQGRGDDLLSTLCLASEAPIAIAPAMNRVMWADVATQANVETLQDRGIHRFGPAEGAQACGEIGEGRLLEVPELVARTAGLFAHQGLLGKRVLITAGPTREALDPVRYLSNRSSGRMGFAMAAAAREAGAAVTLIAGPVHLPTPEGVERVDVISAAEMLAAVADFLNNIPEGYYSIGTDVEKLQAAIDAGATVIDVRQPEEYEQGAITGAINIPIRELAQNLDQIPTDAPVIVYCASGHRAAMSTAALHTLGLDGVRAFPPGYGAWEAAQQ